MRTGVPMHRVFVSLLRSRGIDEQVEVGEEVGRWPLHGPKHACLPPVHVTHPRSEKCTGPLKNLPKTAVSDDILNQ